MSRRFALSVLALPLLVGAPLAAETVAFVGATVHPVSGPAIANATLVATDGRITALGADVAAPAGARVVDVRGKHLYPGFVAAATDIGLVEISSVRGTVDTRELGDVNSHLRAEVAFNADSLRLEAALAGGVTTAQVVPPVGLIGGTSATMRLAGWNWRDMTLAAPTGIHIRWPSFASAGDDASPEEAAEKRKEQLKGIDTTLADARAYGKARAAKGSPAVAFDARLEALLPALDGKLPWFLHANDRPQIESVLDWVKENQVQRAVLVTSYDAASLADRIKESGIPVILNGVHTLPNRGWEPYDAAFTAAERLRAAGVEFAIAAGGSDSSNVRNLPFEAASAAAFGLPPEEALRAVTLSAAKILGVADRVGSLEVGKEATLLVTDGDPLEILTRIEAVWVAGKAVDLGQHHQRRLYEKYNNRPRPAGR